ncbi:hypothetical protein [Clostridium sp.]|uniref:hypothetical protein n=1 Tax=Clostridium sp. TaxID=1506 RepID=UPI003D6CEECC
MKSKNIKSKIMAGLVLACMTISTASAAFGATTAPVNTNIETKLSALVTAGTITSSQLTSIETAIMPSGNISGEKGSHGSNLDALVTDGTITAAQQTAIETALMPSDNVDGEKVGHGSNLDALVTDGTITAAQQTAIETALKSADKTEAGRKTTLDTLVTSGTITSAQETSIIAAPAKELNDGGQNGGRQMGGHGDNQPQMKQQ